MSLSFICGWGQKFFFLCSSSLRLSFSSSWFWFFFYYKWMRDGNLCSNGESVGWFEEYHFYQLLKSMVMVLDIFSSKKNWIYLDDDDQRKGQVYYHKWIWHIFWPYVFSQRIFFLIIIIIIIDLGKPNINHYRKKKLDKCGKNR